MRIPAKRLVVALKQITNANTIVRICISNLTPSETREILELAEINIFRAASTTYLSSLKVKTYLSPSNLSFSIGNRKRQLEDFEKSKTVDKLLDLVGRGHMSVTAACEVAGGVAEDHALPHAAVRAFESLGSEQKHPQNNERDLHRWVKNLYGLQLQPYKVFLDLQMDSLKKRRVPMTVLFTS